MKGEKQVPAKLANAFFAFRTVCRLRSAVRVRTADSPKGPSGLSNARNARLSGLRMSKARIIEMFSCKLNPEILDNHYFKYKIVSVRALS
eukprot:scaffold327482_cov14-Prasinocladus_malaysianus.AAC.1